MSSNFARIYANILNRETLSPDFGSGVFDAMGDPSLFAEFQNGVVAGKADLAFLDTRTLAPSASENLDLQGSLLTPGGRPFLPVKLVAISVYAHADNVNDVLVGGAASAGMFSGLFGDATDVVKVQPDGVFVWASRGAGAVVTATTADILKVLNGGGTTSVTYDIKMLGRSA